MVPETPRSVEDMLVGLIIRKQRAVKFSSGVRSHRVLDAIAIGPKDRVSDLNGQTGWAETTSLNGHLLEMRSAGAATRTSRPVIAAAPDGNNDYRRKQRPHDPLPYILHNVLLKGAIEV